MNGKRLAIFVVVGLLVIGLAVLAGAALLYYAARPALPSPGTVLEVQFSGELTERPRTDPWSVFSSPRGMNLWDLRRALKSAKTDERIGAVLLNVGPFSASWAQIEEIRALVEDFKQSGKPVVAFLELDIAQEGDLLLAGAADRIVMNPVSGFLIDGLMAQVTFYKRTLDKLGIRAEFFQLKEYKNPGNFTRTSLTPEVQEMLTSLISDLQAQFVSGVSEARGKTPAEIEELVDRGLIPAEVALQHGLVDKLSYRAELLEELRKQVGTERYRAVSLPDYLKTLSPGPSSAKARVAYVSAEGVIVTWGGTGFGVLIEAQQLTRELRDIRDIPEIKGVILRIDSSGGSAVASDMIWKEVGELEAAGKPVIVSMGGTAASGGYYIAMNGRRIVAEPSTITGSIGVIFGKFDLSGLYDWLGIDVQQVKGAPNAGFFSLARPLTPEQARRIEEWMGDVYHGFVGKAAEARGMDYDQMEMRARGRIYTGRQALEQGLVDTLGGVDEAVTLMKEELGLTPEDQISLQLFPEPKTILEALLESGFLGLSVPPVEEIRELLQELQTPRAWLIAPTVTVR